MNLSHLVRDILAFNGLEVRAWVAEALEADVDWSQLARPDQLSDTELAVAAGVVEVLAERAGQSPPPWTATISQSPEPLFLLKSVETMPRLKALCQSSSPEPLRKRQIYAPPGYLQAV